jgi:hypothetical protein
LIQVEDPLSETIGLRNISEFGVFWIWEYLHRIYRLSIPNPKVRSLKCSEILNYVSTDKVLKTFQILGHFRFSN